MPGGEFFFAPVDDSAEGVIAYSEFPAVYGSDEVSGIRLRFQGGRVVDASAESNEEFLLSTLDTDLKKLGESAQDLALRGVGVAAEYAVKARETYEKVAEHGEQTVRTWRGEAAEEIEELAIAVEPNAEPVEVKEEEKPTVVAAEEAPSKKSPAKKASTRKPVARKTTPPAK